MSILNMVRDRSGATMYLSTDFASQDAFRSAVLLERRLEFPLEMHRWFDLIRTNTAEEAMAKGRDEYYQRRLFISDTKVGNGIVS